MKSDNPTSGPSRLKRKSTVTDTAIRITHTIHYQGCEIQFMQIDFPTDSGKRRKLIVERADLHSPQKMKRELLNHGYNLPPGKDALVDLIAKLTAIKPKKVRHILAQIGWYGCRFVLPDKTIPEGGGEELAFQAQDSSRAGNFDVAGTLEEWKSGVALPALCSSRFMFAISLALAAPLLPFSGVEGGGVHIAGESSRGKTTALLVAMSVSGEAVRSRLITWDITAAGLSEVAAAHNHTLLCIDEMGQASEADGKLAKRLQTTAFTLASGRGRIRSKAYNKSVGAFDLKWSLLFLSTGEKALSDIATESAVTRLKGEEVRFIDLPALAHPDFGVFERLPDGVSDPASFAESIEAACRKYHGTAFRVFVAKLAKNYDKIPDRVRERMDFFMKKAGVPDNGWEQRFAKRFALAYAAASMAITVKILPWSMEQAFEAIHTCYRAARMRVPDTSNILTGGLARLKERLAETDRLPVYKKESPPSPSNMMAADGFRRSLAPHGRVYLLKSEPFSNWFDSSLQFDVVIRHLEDRGILLKGRDDCRTLQHQLKGIDSRARYYTLKYDPLQDL